MEVKESKTNSHFYLTMTKSFIRISAALFLTQSSFGWAGILFFVAELVDIMGEE